MNLEDFPMDIQRCPLEFGSCEFNNSIYFASLKDIIVLFLFAFDSYRLPSMTSELSAIESKIDLGDEIMEMKLIRAFLE